MVRTTFLFAAVAAFAAAPAGAQLNQDHGQYSRTDIEAGQRLYGPQCQVCHGATGDGVPGIDLRLGKFRRVTSDEDIARIVTTGIPGVGMPPFKFQTAEITSLVAFIRAGFDPASASVRVGNPDRGRALFAGKAECASCHRVNGRGPRLAPDLSDIGAIRTLAALQRAVLEPNESLLPIHRPVRVVTKSGETIRGRRLNEDTFTVQLIDDKERLRSLEKSNLKQYTVETAAAMPSARGKLTDDELADLIAYLTSLKGL